MIFSFDFMKKRVAEKLALYKKKKRIYALEGRSIPSIEERVSKSRGRGGVL